MKMDTKKLLVSFVALLSVFLLASTVSAVVSFNVDRVTVDGIEVSPTPNTVSLVAGETATVKVYFTADDNDPDPNVTETASDVKVRAELEGDKVDVVEVTQPFDVEDGNSYVKVLTLKVPYELKDELSRTADLNLKIWGGNSVNGLVGPLIVTVQRPSYDVDFMSVSTSQTAEAGKLFPVNVVVKNIGYNDLDDLFVTVRIPELGVEKQAYFGDLVAIENNNDDDDNDVVSGRILLDVPYTAKNGVYTLEVTAESDNLNAKKVMEVVVGNSFSSNVFVSGNQIVVANPTSELLVLRLVPESTNTVSVTLSDELVIVPAGTSKTVTFSSNGEGKVNLFSKDGKFLDSVALPSVVETAVRGSNAMAVLTVILTVVFLVLLVVLIVLVTKKPEKSDELSESSYY